MAGPLLRTEHLSREVAGKKIVDDISLEICAGDVLAVVGPSAAGKSSLLRLLNRLDEPTAGTVYLDGVDYRRIAPREVRRRIGLVLQTPHLFPSTVAENLRFGPRQRGEILPESVGLAGYENRDVYHLSGGEAQRVNIARTLANSPEIILLDEPTSALDDVSESGVEALIQDLIQKMNLTCLMITHDDTQARRLAKRILVMEKGRQTRLD